MFFHLPIEKVDDVPDLRSAGWNGGQAQKAAHVAFLLTKHNLVPAARGNTGQGHAGRPGPHDQNLFGTAGFVIFFQQILTAHLGIDHAGARLQGQYSMDAAQAAADAGPHIRQVAGDGLVGQLGIGQERTTHGDSIGLAFLDQAIGQLGAFDTPDPDNRNVDHRLHGGRQVDETAVVDIHGRDRQLPGTVHAGGDMQVVGSVFLQNGRQAEGIVQGPAAFDVVITVDTHPHRKIRCGFGFDIMQQFQDKANPVLEGPAVFIFALVGIQR